METTKGLFQRWGMVFAGIWFILWGCATLFSLAVPPVLMGILAVIAGIGIFVSR